MPLPARHIPESVAALDVDVIAAALVRCNASVRNAAHELGVPSADLRKMLLLDDRFTDAMLEAAEQRLDDAEANLDEALHCDDPRRRDAASVFFLRNTSRAARRGYAVANSAASLEVSFGKQEPQQFIVTWGEPGDREPETETIERDGQTFEVPKYGKRDDVIEGELSKPATMINHHQAAVTVTEPVEPIEPIAPAEPPLPAWTGPYPPPPLVAHLYRPFVAQPRGRPPQPSQPRKVIYE